MTAAGMAATLAAIAGRDGTSAADLMRQRDAAPMERLAKAAELVIAARAPQEQTHQGGKCP